MTIEHVQAALADAAPALAGRLYLIDPAPGEPRGERAPGDWTPDPQTGLPPDCPVIPLGVQGDMLYFLDTVGQVRPMNCSPMGQAHISALFAGRINYLMWAWPQINKAGNCTGFQANKVREALQSACARRGLWRGNDFLRGRGCWPGEDGTLIYHAGNTVYVDGERHEPGMIGQYVYPAGAALPVPSRQLSRGIEDGRELLRELGQWQWARGTLDQMLMLGWMVQARVSGATRWRPAVYVTGEAGSGKSTLQEWVRATFGEGIVGTSNSTAAGLWQSIGYDSLPIAYDEAEASADTRRAEQILELMRASASGDTIRRGGDNHKAHTFQMRSQFFVSSITPIPMKPQDRSRIVMLQLQPIAPGSQAHRPETEPERLGKLGRGVMRHVMEHWHCWPARLRIWRAEISALGADERVSDTYGHLLAMADLALSKIGMMEEGTDYPTGVWIDQLREVVRAAMVEREPAWAVCMQHLLASRPADWRAETYGSIGDAARAAWDAISGATNPEDQADALNRARKALGIAGMGVQVGKDNRPYLCVPARNPRLQALFRGTEWFGLAAQKGVWNDTLGRIPEEHRYAGDNRFRLDGQQVRGTMIDLQFLLDGIPDPDTSRADKGLTR